jgi:hypothetical protein
MRGGSRPSHSLVGSDRRLKVLYLLAKLVIFVSEVAHKVGHTVRHGVELYVYALLPASLGVLEERHQEEGDYGCGVLIRVVRRRSP